MWECMNIVLPVGYQSQAILSSFSLEMESWYHSGDSLMPPEEAPDLRKSGHSSSSSPGIGLGWSCDTVQPMRPPPKK